MKLYEVRLDELGIVSRGRSRYRPRDSEHLYGGPYPFFQTGDIKRASLFLYEHSQTYSEAGLTQSKLWPAGTLCITIAANIAETAILGIDACFPDSVIGFIADESKADARYVKYYFDTVKQEYQQVSKGATQDNLSLEKLLSFALTLPHVTVQRQVAHALSAYNDLMENNSRRIKLLEEAARLLYEEWFVRLRFPGHEHTPVADGLPGGWGRVAIGDYFERGDADLQTGPFGTQLRASDYTDSGTPVINVRNIGYGDLRPDKLEFVPDTVVDRLSKHVLRTGDIAFGRKGAVDRHLLIGPAQDGWMQGSDCIRLRALSEAVCTVYLSFAFRQEPHKQWMLTQCGNKATMASLNQEVIGRIEVTVPPHPLLVQFRDFVSPILSQIGTLQQQSKKAAAGHDVLLPRLMSGQIEP